MKAVVLAEMLRETLEAKINKIRREIQVTYMPIQVERLEAQIMVIRWVQARIQDLVINNNNHGEDKDPKIRI
jgi:vacuolar-type H+-ATPase subunit E/Vma4